MCSKSGERATRNSYVLEQKVDKLIESVFEQRDLLTLIREDLKRVLVLKRCGNGPVDNFHNEQNVTNETIETDVPNEPAADAEILHFADVASLDGIIREAVENFLMSDAVRESVVGAAVESVRGAVHDGLEHALAAAAAPALQRCQQQLYARLASLVEERFKELERKTKTMLRSVYEHNMSKIQTSLDNHQRLLEANVAENIVNGVFKGVLQEELVLWRRTLMQELGANSWDSSSETAFGSDYYEESPPPSPPQPANPNTSMIDTFMQLALINKKIREGDLNAAFERALFAGELALVVAACRAAPPAPTVPAAPRLRPPLLLALLQQLSTDMVHETHLKCRYLEEAVLSLSNCDAETRLHLPLVVNEARKHLTRFLRAYPNHHARRRVALIIAAAANLLK